MAWITTASGSRIHFEQRGAGETLLLVSGWGGDAPSWEAELTFFGASMHCLTLDHPGLTGLEEDAPPERAFGAAAMADRIAEGLVALDIERAAVLGLSMGGAVAQELALRHPHLVGKLVLTGSFARLDIRAARAIATCKDLLRHGDQRTALRMIYWLVFGASFYADHLAELDALLETRLASPIPLEVFEYQAIACLDHDTRARLGEIACPTLVTHGLEDVLVAPAHGRALAAGIPGARLLEFAGCGHCHLWETPVPYREAVLEFLAD